MGFFPCDPLFCDDTKGGGRPPCGIPHGPCSHFRFLWALPRYSTRALFLMWKKSPPGTKRNMSSFHRAGGRSIVNRPAVDQMTKT